MTECTDAGIEIEYEPSPPLNYILNYTPDFLITRADGSKVYVEAKGYFKPEDRTKMLRVREANPDIDIRLVFMRDNKLHAKSRMRYSDWCVKHGFVFALGNIPVSWGESEN